MERCCCLLKYKRIIAVAKEAKVMRFILDMVFKRKRKVASSPKDQISIYRPNEKALKVFGDKTSAKALASDLSVPVILELFKTSLKQAENFFKGLKKIHQF